MSDDYAFQGIITKLRTTKGSPYALDVMSEAADRIEADAARIRELAAQIEAALAITAKYPYTGLRYALTNVNDGPLSADAEAFARAEQRDRDNEPCPTCGGDRLRTDFTGSGRCHAAFPASPTEEPKEKNR